MSIGMCWSIDGDDLGRHPTGAGPPAGPLSDHRHLLCTWAWILRHLQKGLAILGISKSYPLHSLFKISATKKKK